MHPEITTEAQIINTSHFNGNRAKILPEVKPEVRPEVTKYEKFNEIPQCATGLELVKLYKVWSFQGKQGFSDRDKIFFSKENWFCLHNNHRSCLFSRSKSI